MSESSSAVQVPREGEPKGIGGWLLLPAAQLILAPISFILLVGQFFRPNVARFLFDSTAQVLKSLFVLGTLLHVVLFAFGIFCIVQFFGLKRRTLYLMPLWYCVSILWAGTRLAEVFYAPTPGGGIPYVSTIGADIALLIYFCVSKRVKNTFVR
ncbi:MAG TPA: DUF2569 domain-containing protein [Rhizomicrobium sp.]